MIIVGLGNPGKKYALNRHNAGMQFVNWLYHEHGGSKPWQKDPHNQCEYTHIHLEGEDVVLVKPLSFMNVSGQSVNSYLHFYDPQVKLSQVVVAHDDLDVTLGTWKFDFGKGPKGHNGILSLEEHFKTSLFWRLRIGVDNRIPDLRISGETYVLDDFSQEEYEMVRIQYTHMWDAIYKNVTS